MMNLILSHMILLYILLNTISVIYFWLMMITYTNYLLKILHNVSSVKMHKQTYCVDIVRITANLSGVKCD